jgi:hypothetical protein
MCSAAINLSRLRSFAFTPENSRIYLLSKKNSVSMPRKISELLCHKRKPIDSTARAVDRALRRAMLKICGFAA